MEDQQPPTYAELVAQIRKDAATIQKLSETMEMAAIVTMKDLVAKPLWIHNLTNSSAHLKTNYPTASFTEIEKLPDLELPAKFWNAGVRFEKARAYSTEPHVTQFLSDLLRGIVGGLQLQSVNIVPELENMDISPDLVFTIGNNRVHSMACEVKKGNGGSKTWKSDSEVAGQVFEQLSVTQMGVGGPAYGIVSTFNEVRLVSTNDFGSHKPLVIGKELEQSEKKTTPDKEDLPVFANDLSAASSHRSGVKTIPMIKKDPDDPQNKTRMGAIVVEKELPRTFFSSKVFALGMVGDLDLTEKNKAVIKLLATAILLAQESTEVPKTDLSAESLKTTARVFNFVQQTIYPASVELSSGIRFDVFPRKQDKKFYSFSQIGCGANAVCCLATAPSGAVCVLKIFHQREEPGKELAAEEFLNWRNVYEVHKVNNWTFIRSAEIRGIHFLVLPYFSVPRNKEERESFMEGHKKSKLWKALAEMADQGYAHDDLKWHHVGDMWGDANKRNRDGGKVFDKKAYLFDLGKVSKLAVQDQDKWVTDSFEMLKSRAGSDCEVRECSRKGDCDCKF